MKRAGRDRSGLAVVALAAAVAVIVAPAAEACGVNVAPLYSFTRRPGPPLDEFVAGHLGLISDQWDPAALWVAFRYLEGLPVDGPARAALRAYWVRTSSEPSPVSTWVEAVRRAGGTTPAYISADRRVDRGEGRYSVLSYYRNCLDDAFLFASRTLDDRVSRYGRGSREVEAWLVGQNAVFENCDFGDSDPARLDERWDPRLRADREYQRAAAVFYAGRYQLAEERFRAIAAGASEWAGLASFLVARAQIRQDHLPAAEVTLRAVLADPGPSSWHPTARRLLNHVAARLRPEEREAGLAAALFGRRLDSVTAQDIDDYVRLGEQIQSSSQAQSREFWTWVRSLRASGEPARPDAAARFLERPTLPRLILALRVRIDDPAAGDAVLRAAEQVPPASPAYLTVSALRAQRLAEQGLPVEARRILDDLLALSPQDLSASDRNALRRVRAGLAESLEEFAQLMLLRPVGEAFDGAEGAFLAYSPYAGRVLLPPEALYTLNHGVDPERWIGLVRAERMPRPWQRAVAGAGFVRATVDGRDALARTFAEELVKMDRSLAPSLEPLLQTGDVAEREFLSALVMLRHPGFSYLLHDRVEPATLIGSWRTWCSDNQTAFEPLLYRPLFLGPGPAPEPRLPPESAAAFLGRRVLPYADAHPSEPRVPEALHRIVRLTRYTSCASGNGELSRAAFLRLHRRYGRSPWAQRTPYWFN